MTAWFSKKTLACRIVDNGKRCLTCLGNLVKLPFAIFTVPWNLRHSNKISLQRRLQWQEQGASGSLAMPDVPSLTSAFPKPEPKTSKRAFDMIKLVPRGLDCD